MILQKAEMRSFGVVKAIDHRGNEVMVVREVK